jgi:hypothetical protein
MVKLIVGLTLFIALSTLGFGDQGMVGGEGMKKNRREPPSQTGKMGPASKTGDSGMAEMSLPRITLRGKPDRTGGMSQGMTERRPIGMSKMAQGVPGISDRRKVTGQPSRTRRKGSGRTGM